MMLLLLLATTLAVTPDSVDTYPSLSAASAVLAKQVQTGTLLLNRGDCLAIKVYTNSPYTHVAAVVIRNGRPMVYDSMNGAGVRRLPLDRYLQTQRPDIIHIFQPTNPFTKKRAQAFEKALEEELGRPYEVKHHLTGRPAAGLHCSEYVADALQSAKLIRVKRPSKVSPASLVEGILKANLYSAERMIQIHEPSQPRRHGDNWCEQLWIDTKLCTYNSCVQLRRWFLCD